MAKNGRAAINLTNEAVTKFARIAGPSRKLATAMLQLIEWLDTLDPDIRVILFDEISPEAEANLLELITKRAHARAGLPAPKWPEILTDEQMDRLNANKGLDDLARIMQTIVNEINDRKMRVAASQPKHR